MSTVEQDGIVLSEEDSEALRARIARFMDTRGCILWGQAFDVNSGTGRAKAIDWFEKQIVTLLSDEREW